MKTHMLIHHTPANLPFILISAEFIWAAISFNQGSAATCHCNQRIADLLRQPFRDGNQVQYKHLRLKAVYHLNSKFYGKVIEN